MERSVPSRLLGRIGDPDVPIEDLHESAPDEFVVIESKAGGRAWQVLPTLEPASAAVVGELIRDADPSVTRLLTHV